MGNNEKTGNILKNRTFLQVELDALLYGTFEFSYTDQRLDELAKYYHLSCELYDLTVCHGRIGRDGIMPASKHEFVLVNRNALQVRTRIIKQAEVEGISRNEVLRAIAKRLW